VLHLPEDENQLLEEVWAIMRMESTAQSSKSEQIVAEQSGRYIQLVQPQPMIDAVRHMVVPVSDRSD
jgi:hypothetical protein